MPDPAAWSIHPGPTPSRLGRLAGSQAICRQLRYKYQHTCTKYQGAHPPPVCVCPHISMPVPSVKEHTHPQCVFPQCVFPPVCVPPISACLHQSGKKHTHPQCVFPPVCVLPVCLFPHISVPVPSVKDHTQPAEVYLPPNDTVTLVPDAHAGRGPTTQPGPLY